MVRVAMFAVASAVAAPAALAQTFTILHEFNGAADGASPQGELLLDAAGNLFGTTFAGGLNSQGTVFKIDTAGTHSTVFNFSAFETGASPATPLLQDDAGNLFGIADIGPGGAGVVYELSPAGEQELLLAFQGSTGRNARVPSGGIRRDRSGNFFGTTLFGGTGRCQFGCGSVFRLDTAGALRVLYTFTGGADGSKPFGPLLAEADGSLIGVAQSGGALCAEAPRAGCGTIFKLTRDRQLTVLHTFQGGADGAIPQPGLLRDAEGNLIGAASAGGTPSANMRETAAFPKLL